MTQGLVIACLLHIPPAVLVALAVAALVDPAVAGGSRAVGVGWASGCVWPAAWPCSPPRFWPSAARGSPRRQRGELVVGRPEAAAVATVSQVTCQSRCRSTGPPACGIRVIDRPTTSQYRVTAEGSGSAGLRISHAGQ